MSRGGDQRGRTANTSNPSGEQPVLEVSHLAAGYGDLQVLWDVTFAVRAGEITALLGRNGAGKTTTLRTVAGLNRCLGGSIVFKGHDIAGVRTFRRARSGIGMVQENKRIFKRRTVEENLLLGGSGVGVPRRELRQDLDGVYGYLPILRDRAKSPAGALSGGQQQMLAIGQALMGRPELLMLDEPSAGLAPSIVREVFEVVAQLKSRGHAILLVEQAIESALSVADHVTVLDLGRVVIDCPAQDVDDVAVLRDAYFGRTVQSSPQTRQ